MIESVSKPKILFLCTGNSCRSQMAEGIARRYYNEKFDIYSAGIEKHGMNPYAMKVMEEAGIDISSHSSKTLDEIDSEFDYIVTVCDHAQENCPTFVDSTKVYHFPFPDPPKLALEFSDENKKLDCYRQVRDRISQTMKEIVSSLN